MTVQSTRNATVFDRLRSDILTGRLVPGERLKADALRQRYAVGGSPIREALMRLQAEGFVELEQNKGFRVSGVSRRHLRDLTRSRIEIESILLRWSIARGGVEWEAELIGALHRLSSVPKPAPSGHLDGDSTWFRYHRAFHLALVAACDSPILLSIGRRLFDQAERYVALSIASKGALRDDVGEHAAIMEAAIARDVERAVTLNREHIERTADKIEHARGIAFEPDASAA